MLLEMTWASLLFAMDDYNIIVDTTQIPNPGDVPRRCLAQLTIQKWKNHADFEAGLPPDSVEVDAEEFMLTQEEAAAALDHFNKNLKEGI